MLNYLKILSCVAFFAAPATSVFADDVKAEKPAVEGEAKVEDANANADANNEEITQ